ncbi:hypothetical protein DQ04_01921080 [Trypanosoma grayi]|uniref:hypothetical protein n=1 Tax=Trypanosoma grayi TaxID=71804 RepID=UPI0004F4806A|nr:hypothetical protein DQ04_01921080 [Trypanosoma grayi]KEG12185.1 hypothetical protein DQ04_01921080 [Trypanosoma grayi]
MAKDAPVEAALRHIRICECSEDVRVAVVATHGVTVVDLTEPDMRLRYRPIHVNGRACNAMVERAVPPPAAPVAHSSPTGLKPLPPSSSLWLSKWGITTQYSGIRDAVDAAFIATSCLAIVFSDEAVVVELGADPKRDFIKWRICSSYSTLAVCRTNMHLAFALHSSAVEVFPLKVTCRQQSVTPPMECEPSVIFSPTHKQNSFLLEPMRRDTFAWRGVSAKLGVYKVTALEWHRVASHTILCVTCQHPHDGRLSVALFTVQSMSLAWPLKARKGEDSADVLPCHKHDHSLQLIPRGNVSLSTMSSAPLTTQLVPTLSRSRDTASLSNKLEFLSLDKDGTVRTMSYRFGQQKQGGFPKQRSAGLTASKVLLPLQKNYGEITHMSVLPIWKARAVEFGTFTPQAEQLMGARRYRLLVHFASGMVAKVMVDLLTSVARLEAFLTLGADPLPLCLTTSRGACGEKLLLGLSQERAFVIERVVRAPGIAETTVRAVAPILAEHRHRFQVQNAAVVATDTNKGEETAVAGVAAPTVAGVVVTGNVGPEEKTKREEEAVRLFMEVKCPDKVRMIPSLLKACSGDAGKLLTQLTAKYGPVEPLSVVYNKSHNDSSSDSAPIATATATATATAASGVPTPLVSPSSPISGVWLTANELQATADGFAYTTRLAMNSVSQMWQIPAVPLESFAAAMDEIVVHTARFPATAPVRCLGARPVEHNQRHPHDKSHDDNSHDADSEVSCEWVEATGSVSVRAPMLPDEPPLSLRPFESYQQYRPVQLTAMRLASNVIIVAVMGATVDAECKTVFLLYALDLLRDVAAPPMFTLELEVHDVISFVLCRSGDAVLLRRHQKSVERRTRVANDSEEGYCWCEAKPAADAMLWREEITAMAPLWMEGEQDRGDNQNTGEKQLEHLLFLSSDGSFIHTCDMAAVQEKPSAPSSRANASATVGMELWHPTAVLVLLGIGRSRVVQSVLRRVQELATTTTTDSGVCASAEPCVTAMEMCHNPISVRLYEQPSVAQDDAEAAVAACIASLDPDAQQEEEQQLLQQEEKDDGTTPFGAELTLELLERVMELLPTLRLRGLDSQEQLTLLCVLDAMRAAKLLGTSLDVAASRFFFLYKLQQLQRRLRVHATPSDDVLHTHSAFLWAALSDAQPQLLDGLFSGHSEKGAVTWQEVEAAGVPLWLQSRQALRALAERVARGQYHATKDVRECALMYALAGKVGVLAALCKAERNEKLYAFFSRNFTEPKHREAASNNAFVAVSKNQVTYGAAFFALAGDARSAAQVLLQRHNSVALALFVLRLAGNDTEEDLMWFMEQRRREEVQYGPMDAWEEACLQWRCGHTQEALLLLARRTPLGAADAADRLSLLRYEGRRKLGAGGHLPLLQELLLLLRITRLSDTAGMRLPTLMCCREAEALLVQMCGTQVGGGDEGATGDVTAAAAAAVAAAALPPPRMEADFNTGTLAFHGFDIDDYDDSDDNDENRDVGDSNNNMRSTGPAAVETASAFAAGSTATNGLLDAATSMALERELQYTRRKLQKAQSTNTMTSHRRGDRDMHTVLVCCAHLVVAVGRQAPITVVEKHLTRLFERVLLLEDDHADVTGAGELLGVGSRLVIIAVRLALLSVMLQNADYALANALLGYPSLVDVLHEQKSEAVTLHTVASYVRAVRNVHGRVRAMTAERVQHNLAEEQDQEQKQEMYHTLGSAYFSTLTGARQGEPDDGHPSTANEEELRGFLLAWCAAFLQLCALSELREEVQRLRAVLSQQEQQPPTSYSRLLMLLLGCMLCRTTLAFNAAAAQLVGYVMTVRQLDDSLATNPNGIFVEEEQELQRVAELLESNLVVSSSETEPVWPLLQMVSLDLCVGRAEFFWQLPQTIAKISTDTDAVVVLLRDATQPHAAAHLLYGQLSDGAAVTLRRVEAAWLRRHHTHSSYRKWLLETSLRGSLTTLITTDRLVLQQACHAVGAVDYDRSSCDSLVWGTSAGVEVGHGYREILAGDNEAAMLREQPDRNVATAAFSMSLSTADGEDGAEEATATTTTATAAATVGGVDAMYRSTLSRRPRFSLAANARVASHPHLPFFLARHSDGCVDLYAFTCTECVATFSCQGSYVVTDIAYSPNGYTFAAGLADGSVRGWCFGLGAATSDALFVHRILPPGGVKVTMFCGNQPSLLVVVGFDFAGKANGAAAGGSGAPQSKRANPHQRPTVGVLLILDVVVHGGVVVRRDLPFVPEYAAYIRNPDSVLCVAADGRAALYDMRKSHLYIIAPTPVMHPPATVSCLAVSHYDDLVALGTEDGHALLLQFSTILEVAHACVEDMDVHATETSVSEESVLHKSSRMQLAPVLTSRCGVRCMVFTPSVLLAGLADGKLVAATLVSNALRQGNMVL